MHKGHINSYVHVQATVLHDITGKDVQTIVTSLHLMEEKRKLINDQRNHHETVEKP